MENPDPFQVISGASSHESVRSGHYRWNCLNRGEKPQVILQRTLAGEGCLRVGNDVSRMEAGRVFVLVVPEDAEYWFDPTVADGWTFQWINIEGAWTRELWLGLRGRFSPTPPMDPRGAAARAFSLLIADFLANRLQDRLLQAEACYSFFLHWWQELEGGRENAATGHAALRRLIQRRHREPVNIKELCAEVGQSREHLTRAFRAAWGVEPASWMRELRLQAAETYIRHGASHLDDIARRVGFGSGRQLARAFRASRGVTPAGYRARIARVPLKANQVPKV
ncbi:MAG: hypothetical protein Fur0032_13670 [Terrimicrobiaceae bacterium]